MRALPVMRVADGDGQRVGHGDKKQIHMMVKVLMPKAAFDGDDAADALAIAICHAHHRQSVSGRLAAAGLAAAV